jgi:PhzF family phenazine biosynthesis protein
MEIWLVDAFTAKPFGGNPAGLCFIEEFPETPIMQRIAAEMNWSQTAFIVQKSDHHFHIRWFSPRDEAPLCGHATLAASHLIWQEKKSQSNFLSFDSLGGLLTAERQKNDWIHLNFPAKTVVSCPLQELLQQALGNIPIQSVYKDDILYLLILRDAQAVRTLKPDLTLIEQLDCRAVVVTATGEEPYDFVSRYFAPKVGIPEDPVCGSAHCRLIPFWANILKKNELFAYQASPRGGILKLSLIGDRVSIGGQATTICVCRLRVT